MNPALMLVTAATLGWSGPAEFRPLEPNDLLAAAFVVRMTIDARLAVEPVSPEAVSLELWYPPVPAARVLDVAHDAPADARRDTRYDLRLPFFRFKA